MDFVTIEEHLFVYPPMFVFKTIIIKFILQRAFNIITICFQFLFDIYTYVCYVCMFTTKYNISSLYRQ